MPMTMSEKILARASEKDELRAGDIIEATGPGRRHIDPVRR